MIKNFNTILILVLLCGWLCYLPSCQVVNKNYGKRVIAFKNDSTKTIERKRSLNKLDDQDFLQYTFSTSNNLVIPYRLLPPINNQPTKKYPLIITLHNSSRIGSDNRSQLEPLARLWLDSTIRKNYQGYVLAPQFSARSTTYATDSQKEILTSKPEPALLALINLIDSLKKDHNIDKNRIYLVGYSMGASSVINLLNFKPSKFAAAVAIASVPQFDHSDLLSNIPIWLIHGTGDNENPFSGSEKLYGYINLHHKTRYWVFHNRTHDNIVSTKILDKSIPEWLFSKKRNDLPSPLVK